MKKIMMLLIIVISFATFADVELTITVPTAYVQNLVDSYKEEVATTENPEPTAAEIKAYILKKWRDELVLKYKKWKENEQKNVPFDPMVIPVQGE